MAPNWPRIDEVKITGPYKPDSAAGLRRSRQEVQMSERDYPYWNRVYWLVIVYAILLILALWLISSRFD
ncbi:MAG: hypothetical protein EBZ36_17580 [Acidobacteria bacterium]|nr:hypothetical protein [Acidobacteriota bacterium]